MAQVQSYSDSGMTFTPVVGQFADTAFFVNSMAAGFGKFVGVSSGVDVVTSP